MTDRPQLYRFPYARRVLSVAADALIAYWPLSEPSGAAAIDQTGRYHGAYTGVDLNYPGVGDGGSAPFFDGINDFCNIYSAALATAFNGAEGAVSIWMKVSGAGVWTDATLRRLMGLRVDANNQVNLSRSATSNTLLCQYLAGATSKTVSIGSQSSTDWLHLAMTWSKSADQMKVYFQGVQTGATQTGLGTWAGTFNSTRANIGADSTVPATVWSGNLAHAAIWTRALSAGEIAELYRVT